MFSGCGFANLPFFILRRSFFVIEIVREAALVWRGVLGVNYSFDAATLCGVPNSAHLKALRTVRQRYPFSLYDYALRDLPKNIAAKSGLSAEILLRKGRLGSAVSARDRFIREAVLRQGYLASQVASFLNSHPSNISRALQKT